MCNLLNKYEQIKMVQSQNLGFNEIKFGDFLVVMRNILRPNLTLNRNWFGSSYSSNLVEYYLTQAQIEETQKEVISVLNSVLQNTINNTEITWALDDAVDIFMTTGSGVISGNSLEFSFTFRITLIHKEILMIKT